MKKTLTTPSEIIDFSGDNETTVRGSTPTSLEMAKSNLSTQLKDIQDKMSQIQARRGQTETQRQAQAETARQNILFGSLQDAANRVGGVGGPSAAERERQLAMSQQQQGDEELLRLGKDFEALENLKLQAEAGQIGIIGQEEKMAAQAEQYQAQMQMQRELNDPNSVVSQNARATAEIVLGQGVLPAGITAAQIEKVYPDLIKRQQTQADFSQEMRKLGAQQAFQRQMQAADLAAAQQKVAATPRISQSQGAAAGFGKRLQQSEQVFDKLKKQGFDRTSIFSGLTSYLPSFLKSSEQQQQDQAERNFANAQLRRESGAAIGNPEFESAELQYFPRAGDSPEVIEQKARNRAQLIESLETESGPAWEKIQLINQTQAEPTQQPTVERKQFVPSGGTTSSGRKVFQPTPK